MSLKTKIKNSLSNLQDVKYRDFQAKLIPSIKPSSIIGVRTPELRKLAKNLLKEENIEEFLSDLPHKYFDENQLHAFIISEMKDFDLCMKEVCRFLPYVDNWATCDQMSPRVFKKNKISLIKKIKEWIRSNKVYTKRFGIGMLMEHFLDEDFDPSYPKLVAGIKSDEYYINMMRAWYFATALAKQYKAVVSYIEDKKLDSWTHSKTIQKAVESYRITADQKEYLKSLRIKGSKNKEV